jgi:hypothetical protein
MNSEDIANTSVGNGLRDQPAVQHIASSESKQPVGDSVEMPIIRGDLQILLLNQKKC